jgi:HD-GYP domain-containing protein (c-di-GMP phosphodiesterase class II)
MLHAFEPPGIPTGRAFDEIEARARALASQRTLSMEIPDAHARHVATLACDVAARIGLRRNEVDVLVEGALLHDVGKMLVPRAILLKRRPLTRIEYATVKMHPDLGAQIVGGDVPRGAAVAIRHHHEWWDGTGYPSRLARDEIPLEARIVGIADAFAAMREKRPYRSARTIEAAVLELRRNAGTQFDPELVEPLIDSLGEEDEERPRLRLLPRLLFH